MGPPRCPDQSIRYGKLMTDRPTSSPRPFPAAEQPPVGQASPGIGGWAREYAGDLHRFLSKRQFIESDIKDVCQEVYLRLLRFERTEVIQNPLAYLFRVAANVAHDFRLRQIQWTPLQAEQLERPATDPGRSSCWKPSIGIGSLRRSLRRCRPCRAPRLCCIRKRN